MRWRETWGEKTVEGRRRGKREEKFIYQNDTNLLAGRLLYGPGPYLRHGCCMPN